MSAITSNSTVITGWTGNEDTCFPWKNFDLEDESNKAIQKDEVGGGGGGGGRGNRGFFSKCSFTLAYSFFTYVYYLRYSLPAINYRIHSSSRA